MTTVRILVREHTGESRQFRFHRGWIRIGRAPLNDLVIASQFVSGCHGIIKILDSGLTYTDLAPTNPTLIDGVAAAARSRIPLREGCELRIGPVSIFPALLQDSLAESDGPDHDGWRDTDRAEGRQVFRCAQDTPPPCARTTRLPDKDTESKPPVLAAGHAAAELAEVSGRPLAERLAAMALRLPESERRLLNAMVASLEALVSNTLALRNGIQLHGSELGLRSVRGASPMYAETDRDRVLEYLLTAEHVGARQHEITALFSDMLYHPIALAAALNARGELGESFARAYSAATGDDFQAGESTPPIAETRSVAPVPAGMTAATPQTVRAPKDRPARLVVISSSLEGLTLQLANPCSSVGRTPDNDLVVPHPSVSRRHARLTQRGHHWVISDAGSSNGVWVNGTEHASRELAPGDVVELGTVKLRFEA